MMPNRYRQEVLSVLPAQLLQDRGAIAAPENILKFGPEQQRSIPDVDDFICRRKREDDATAIVEKDGHTHILRARPKTSKKAKSKGN